LYIRIFSLTAAVLLAELLTAPVAHAHGDVTPQPVDVSTLKPLGEKLLDVNPYRGDKEAIKVGEVGYAKNCARCHGLHAVSGGVSPELRTLDSDKETDQYFLDITRHGRTRNGKVYMPGFQGVMGQEAIWAIRSYIEAQPKN
jgi:cytochrome c-550 PedF